MARIIRLRGSLAVFVGILVLGPHADAAIFTVGNEPGCTHGTVQGAVDALPPGGVHEIRIKQGTYSAQAIKIVGRELTLRGGYANCAAPTATGSSTLSGNGGGTDSVITITGSGNAIALERLNITHGDEVFDGYGGGIDVRGAGELSTRMVTISNNYAGYGGGISFTATGPSRLDLLEETMILWNQAQFSGGGIRLEGEVTLRAHQDGTWISGNEAVGHDPVNDVAKYGYGGGILLVGNARAEVASPGFGNAAVISDNTARYGGGVAVVAVDNDQPGWPKLTLYSTDPMRPVRIEDNLARQAGGGVYLQTVANGVGSWGTSTPAELCAHDFGINRNTAQNGSAIYAESGYNTVPFFEYYGSWIGLNRGCQLPMDAVRCTAGGACNTIEGNRAETDGGTPTDGATILLQNNTSFVGSRVAVRSNRGGNVLRAFPGGDSPVELYNMLFTSNQTSGALVRNSGTERLSIENSTFAGNSIGSQVFLSTDDIALHRSIVWQPGVPVLSQSGGSRSVGDLIVHDASTIGGEADTVRVVSDPLFLDPAHGDYRPHAASLAVDFAVPVGGTDLLGNPRGTDLALVPDVHGSGDLGAYERVDIDPLVRNGDFNGDLRYWTGGSGIGYDTSHNPSGPASGSGVLKITRAVSVGGRVVSTQCVPLPGPAVYHLSAWARTAGTGVGADRALVGWSLVPDDATGTCVGSITRNGEKFVAQGNTWREMQPLAIEVSPAEWSGRSSLAVHLIAQDSGIATGGTPTAVGYFDGIRLSVAGAGGDSIFADGFEP